MIARHAKVVSLRVIEEEVGCPPSLAVRLRSDVFDSFMTVTPVEMAWARKMRETGTPLVMTIAEEPGT